MGNQKQNSGVRSQESEAGKKKKTPPKASPPTEKEVPELVDTEETEKEIPEVKPPSSSPFEQWGVKEKDNADVEMAFTHLVGLRPNDISRIVTDSPHYPGKIVIVKNVGPNQKLIWDREKRCLI